jgi:hypothetical protein
MAGARRRHANQTVLSVCWPPDKHGSVECQHRLSEIRLGPNPVKRANSAAKVNTQPVHAWSNVNELRHSRIHPIYPALALSIYSKINNLQADQADAVHDALFNSFELSSSVSHCLLAGLLNKVFFLSFYSKQKIQKLSSNKRILCAIETHPLITSPVLEGLKCRCYSSFKVRVSSDLRLSNFEVLSPIDAIKSIVLTLKYTEDQCDVVLITDKINQIEELPTKQQNLNFGHLDNLFRRVCVFL